MTNYNIALDESLLDFESFLTTGIELSSEQIDQAVALSDCIINPERQWQTYLNSLALFGFETWLQERDPNLNINSDSCSVKQPSYANYIDGVFNLTVGDYKLCLLTNGVTIDEAISVDRALIDLPEYAAHFYVLVNVIEEQAEVEIDSFISYPEITTGKQAANLSATDDWTYEIPVDWFNTQSDNLLLALRCLEPNSLTLPESVTVTDNIQSQLEPLLPQLRSATTELHQILTWSQAVAILSNPDLLNWLYQLQTNQLSLRDSIAALGDRLSSTISAATQRLINVKSWLSDELDEIAQSLAWTLLPTPELAASAMRDLAVIDRQSPAQEFAAIMTQLRTSGEDIPEAARGAYQDFTLASHGLRMYAVTWMIVVSEDVLEWSLLLILGAQSDNYIPQGLKLELKEGGTVLDQKTITENTYDSYVYTQVIGELDEQFTVSVKLPDDTEFTFPKFVFN
ncbi:MAG: DUF1822 family protein [Cyanobacteria bacterium P01_G01_bin.39]